MRALVLTGNAKLDYTDIETPVLTGDSVLVRVRAAGICGSDIHRGFGSGAYHYPLVMGHEFSGVVEQAPSGSQFGPGSRVTVFPLLPLFFLRVICINGKLESSISVIYLIQNTRHQFQYINSKSPNSIEVAKDA